MDIAKFKNQNWNKIWAWNWSFLSCSHFGLEYTDLIRFNGRPFMSRAVIFVSHNKSSCLVPQPDRDALGKFLADEVKNNPAKVTEVCNWLKKEADIILSLIDIMEKKEVTQADYRKFWRQVVIYYPAHIYVKYVVDYLESEVLQNFLPQFEDARVYCESVFKRTEDFVIYLTKQISAKTGLLEDLVLCFTTEEMEKFLADGHVPDKNILPERDKNSAMVFANGEREIFIGAEVEKIEKLIFGESEQKIIKGQTAFAGKTTGTVRIVLNPGKPGRFDDGDILVAGMTRPDYLFLMKKARAIVTDAGGLLCHAAIVARELKKPCIIGTQTATKFLKDGDIVEVDATKGVVTKIIC